MKERPRRARRDVSRGRTAGALRGEHEARVEARAPRWPWLESAVILALGAAAVPWVLAGYPGIADLQGWFYRPEERALGSPALLVVALALIVAVLVASRRALRADRPRWALALLVAGASMIHLGGSTVIDDRGGGAAWERIGEGHGQFARVAASRRDAPIETLLDYEALAGAGRLSDYPRSKPPGTLAVYMIVDAIAQSDAARALLPRLARDASGHPATRDMARAAAAILLLFTLGSALTVVPIVALGRELFGSRELGHDAALLYVTSPAFMLIAWHLDNALFPVVVAGACALAARGARRDQPAASAGAGVIGGLAVYLSFGLLAATGLALGCVLVVVADTAYQRGWRSGLRVLLRHAPVVLLGALGAVLATVVFLDFEPRVALERSVTFHERWKAWVPTRLWRGLSVVELAFHFGAPAVFVLVAEGLAAPAALRRRVPVAPALFAVGIAASLAVFAVASGTNEMARLWLYMLPLFCVAMVALRRTRRTGLHRAPLYALAIGQAALTIAMRLITPW